MLVFRARLLALLLSGAGLCLSAAPPRYAAGQVESARAVTSARPSSVRAERSPWGLLFSFEGERDLEVTNLQGATLRKFPMVCGSLVIGRIHASPAGPYAVLTCADASGESRVRSEQAIVLLDLRPGGAPPRTLVRGLYTLVGWSSDGQVIYAWDNAASQRGKIIARDPFANLEFGSYCCVETAMPGPGRSLLGIDHAADRGEREKLLLLEPNGSSRVIVERDGYISEIDLTPDERRVVLGRRPAVDVDDSFLLEVIDIESGDARVAFQGAGEFWLHHTMDRRAFVNEVVSCRARRGGKPAVRPLLRCEESWMVLRALWVDLQSGARVEIASPEVAGYWLSPDGRVVFRRRWDESEVRHAELLRTDGALLGRAPNRSSYSDPVWIRLSQ